MAIDFKMSSVDWLVSVFAISPSSAKFVFAGSRDVLVTGKTKSQIRKPAE